MKIPVNMREVTRIAACGMLIFVAYHILDIIKAAIRVKYVDCASLYAPPPVELLIALAGVCIYAVGYVARGKKEDSR